MLIILQQREEVQILKILVVSGFLGSGKTTFIKTMTEKTGQNFLYTRMSMPEAAWIPRD